MSSKPISPLRKAWFRWKALRLPWRKKFLVGTYPSSPSFTSPHTSPHTLSSHFFHLLSNKLLGLDLSGATFWEFADKLSPNSTRMRRIVQYPRNVHYSDVSSQISPAWHQWLRHTRPNPPSIEEQQQDVVRQEQLKVLAAQADARWASKKSYLDTPDRRAHKSFLEAPGREGGQPMPALKAKDPGGHTQETRPDGRAVDGEGLLRRSGWGSQAEKLGNEMQTPDGKRHPFTRGERPRETVKEMIEKREDPWKKARKGPSEEWQPQAWDPNALAARR